MKLQTKTERRASANIDAQSFATRHAPSWDHPVKGLADCQENYTHCSAEFYYIGEQAIFPIDDIMGLMDIDLSEKI